MPSIPSSSLLAEKGFAGIKRHFFYTDLAVRQEQVATFRLGRKNGVGMGVSAGCRFTGVGWLGLTDIKVCMELAWYRLWA
jgi:hypothetical protein